jgi:hypoxanthine-DNA glycosylase
MEYQYDHVTHESLKPFVPQGCQILILGSLPSIATRAANFYYAHKTNRFYKALAGEFEEDEPLSIQERKEFLTRHHIALYDSIYECDIHASSDASIKNVVSSVGGVMEIELSLELLFTERTTLVLSTV